MIDYPIVETESRKYVAMFTISHRLGQTKFVFTVRTKVRLGGFNMYI